MKNKRSLFIAAACSLIIVCGLMIALTIKATDSKNEEEYVIESGEFFTDSALFTHKDDLTVVNQGAIDFDGFEEKLSNEKLTLYSNNKNGAIRILNKNTGYYWCSDVHDIASFMEDEPTNVIIKKVSSSFRVLYRDKDGKVKEVYTRDSETKLQESVSGNTLKVKAYLSTAKIGFTYEVSLNGEKVNVKIKNDSILEDGDNRLTSLTLFPYLGYAYKDDIPGYIFIPSGSGALIRYSQNSPITSTFIGSFYGVDANITKNSETDILSLPVYGVVQGIKQNAMFAEIKSGSAFANLTFSPPNIDLGFNLVYPSFNYRETYLLQIPGSDQILMVPENFYNEDVEIEYTFLSGDNASYVGMANTYKESLKSSGAITKQESDKENITLQLEAFGRDYERGLLFKKYKNMTTTKEILDMNARLIEGGINDIIYVLRAFNRGGYSNQDATSYKFDGALGSLKDLKELETYFYYNPVESYNNKKSYPSHTLVNLYNEKNYITVESEKYKFYLQVPTIEKYVGYTLDYYEDRVTGVALDGIGYRLYGDKNNNLTRSEVLNKYQELLGDKKVAMFTPNSYFIKNTSKYFNMPMYSARYRFVTDSVPFLEIALKGYVDYYSPYLNFSSNIDLDILKCIEYGINPAFLVTDEASYNLSNTLSSNYYATYFETVYDLIKKDYKYINNALKEVINAEIVNREIVEEGISVVTYSNGKKIIVNYTNDAYLYEGENVSPLSYKVK